MGIPTKVKKAEKPAIPGRVSDAQGRYAIHRGRHCGLADALFTKTQQRVLGQLYGHPERSLSVSELISETGSGSGAVQRELAKLSASGLLTMERVGNQKRYKANPDSPIHAELVAIVMKTVALAEPLRKALASLTEHIRAAFIYGSVATHTDTGASDIDLMIISDTLAYAEVMQAVHPAIEQLERTINPVIYTPSEFARRRNADNAFLTRVIGQSRIWLIGGEDDLVA